MQIITLNKYDWGHCLPATEKSKIADAIEVVQENVFKAKPTQSELIIVETLEDTLE